MTTDRELLDILLKKVTEAEMDYLFRSMEFSRIGFSDDDREECDIHHISFRFNPNQRYASVVSERKYKTGDGCPLCILRRILCSPRNYELTREEYEKRLIKNGYTTKQIKNIVSWSFKDVCRPFNSSAHERAYYKEVRRKKK